MKILSHRVDQQNLNPQTLLKISTRRDFKISSSYFSYMYPCHFPQSRARCTTNFLDGNPTNRLRQNFYRHVPRYLRRYTNVSKGTYKSEIIYITFNQIRLITIIVRLCILVCLKNLIKLMMPRYIAQKCIAMMVQSFEMRIQNL